MSPLARSHRTMMGAAVTVIAALTGRNGLWMTSARTKVDAVPLPGKDRFMYVRKRSTLIPLQEKE